MLEVRAYGLPLKRCGDDEKMLITNKTNSFYDVTDLKLAAVILAEIPESHFYILSQDTSPRKIIKIEFPSNYQSDVLKIVNEFVNRQARVDVFLYNKKLNELRDKIKEAVC